MSPGIYICGRFQLLRRGVQTVFDLEGVANEVVVGVDLPVAAAEEDLLSQRDAVAIAVD